MATEMNQAKIHPIVMYPFVQPLHLQSLTLLFESLSQLTSNDGRFHKPVTIINNQTRFRSRQPWPDNPALTAAYEKAASEIVDAASTVTHTWATDTCAMWLRGLGDAFEEAEKERTHHDVFWLIPGDFNYSTDAGKRALQEMQKIPQRVFDGECEICLGEIEVPPNSSKQLIDTYGTYGLLYNWFPAEAKGMRRVTEKPRTEFFALNYQRLRRALIDQRWYAYEQTLMILLQNMNGDTPACPMRKVELGLITDEESLRSTLPAAMQQVERTERALKLFWREDAAHKGVLNWQDQFRVLDQHSESVRTAAMVILRRVLER